MNIKHRYTRSDFIVVQRNILKNYNMSSLRTLGNGDYVAAYEIYLYDKWFFGLIKRVPYVPIVRFETLYEVDRWLLIETGEADDPDENLT